MLREGGSTGGVRVEYGSEGVQEYGREYVKEGVQEGGVQEGGSTLEEGALLDGVWRERPREGESKVRQEGE